MDPPEDVIFIIGHWRTGSTLLHKLMSIDPEMAAPTLFEVAEPDSFLSSYAYYKPVMKIMISKHRPMDNVVLGMNEPQEDEYALYRCTDFSPLERLVFPPSKKYFLLDADNYVPEKDIETWKKEIIHFFKKIFFIHKKTIVSKNPFNSMRIKELLEIFPEARFIHIVRHPYEVVPSSVHMWNIIQKQNVLNLNYHKPTIEEVSLVFAKMLDVIERDKVLIPHGQFCQVEYEKLEKDPAGEIRKIYKALNLNFTEGYESAINAFKPVLEKYRKNHFDLTDEEKKIISRHLDHHIVKQGYRT